MNDALQNLKAEIDSAPESAISPRAPEKKLPTAPAVRKQMEKKAAEAKPSTGEIERRQERIKNTLEQGGKIVGGKLRTNNGMDIMTLTPEELASAGGNTDTSKNIAARFDAVYGAKTGKTAESAKKFPTAPTVQKQMAKR